MMQQNYELIRRLSAEHSVVSLCQLCGVSRSGYYKWLARGGKPNRWQIAQTYLDDCVQDIHAHYPSMGYRQIRDTLQIQIGWKVCDLSVWRSMQRLQIKGFVRKCKYPSQPGNEHKVYPNLLNRAFHADLPLQKVVSDITHIKHHGKWFFLVCHLDLFNNEIVEWELSDSFDALFVVRCTKRLLEKAKDNPYPILLHSDQGLHYTSSGYCALLEKNGVIQSMSRAGTPRDNAVMESFFGRFKDVLRFQFRYWQADDLHKVITDAIHYFNVVRPVAN